MADRWRSRVFRLRPVIRRRLRRHQRAKAMRTVLAHAWLLAVALSLSSTDAATAPVCAETGEPAPDVVTFTVSKTRPLTEGWIVNPNCQVEAVDVTAGYLTLYSKGIQRVASMVPNVVSISLAEPLSLGADLSAATQLKTLTLSEFSPELLTKLVIPSSVTEMQISSAVVTSIDTVKLPEKLEILRISSPKLASISKVVFPAGLRDLSLSAAALTTLDNVAFSPKLAQLSISSPLKSLDNVIFPDSLRSLYIDEAALSSIEHAKFPPFLSDLSIESLSITSLKNVKFPSTLKQLILETAAPEKDIVFPPKLTKLYLMNPSTEVLERIELPSTLAWFDSKAKIVRGIRWPSTLVAISSEYRPVTTFEIRQSDVTIFDKMGSISPPGGFYLNLTAGVCSDPTGKLTTLGGYNEWKMCVISDERFDALYGAVKTSAPTTKPVDDDPSGSASEADDSDPTETPNGSQGASGSMAGDEVGDEEAPPTKGGKKTRSPSSRPPHSQSPSSTAPQSQFTSPPSATKTAPKSAQRTNSTAAGTQLGLQTRTPGTSIEQTNIVQVSTSMNKAVVVAVVVAGVMLALLVAGFVVRAIFARSRKRGKAVEDHYDSLDTPTTSTAWLASSKGKSATTTLSLVSVSNDVRHDQLLLPYRIKQQDIVLKEQTARQGFGDVFRGTFQGRDVSVKRIQAASSDEAAVVACFMDEIRMCASVDHPKIVSFVGIAWSSDHDLTAIVEFMPGGDLEALLYGQPQPIEACSWTAPWAARNINNKASIAFDVAEALEYLHAFNAPILHRDLRARNVQLDLKGNAKLDSFAINRTASVDETMRGESGSVAWIAPEMLLGEDHSEKADIYAFGVLLVELDRCCHPFASVAVAQGSAGSAAASASEIAQKNIQIAVQVSTGSLRPAVSSSCPQRVAALVAKCLDFNANNRPSAAQVVAEIREIREDTSD